MRTNDCNKVNEIEGVTLTPEAVAQIKSLQENQNEMLNTLTGRIAEAVCELAIRHQNAPDREKQRLSSLMCDLGYFCSDLKKLERP